MTDTATLERDAAEREARLQARRAALETQYRALAEGRPWYEGTDGDPILPHQWVGACYGAVAKRWLLADEPGAGKTRTSIAWLDLIQARKVILVAEANVCAQFAGEAMTLAPHRTIINLKGLSKKTRHEHLNRLLRQPEGIAVVNYEIFRQDYDALSKLMMWQADSMIIDEAHNLKNPRSSNFKYLRDIAFAENSCPSCGALIYGVSRPCGSCGWVVPGGDLSAHKNAAVKDMKAFLSTRSMKNIMPMTGTPVLNDPVDLFTIYHLISPVEFPSLKHFKETFTHPDYSNRRSVFSRKGLEEITKMLKGKYLQRTLADVGIDLPKQRVHVERVELDPVQYPLQNRTIEQVSKHAAIQLTSGEKMTLMHVISIILRKRQANVWPGGIELRDSEGNVTFSVGSEVRESVKMDAVLEKVIECHRQGKRQIIFSQFQTALVEMQRRIQAVGIRAARFDGTTPGKEREKIKNNFYKARGEEAQWDVVLVHYRTGGAGLNLTAATVTHILDEEWNAGRRDQSYARNHRMGQDEETDVYIYRIPGTVDTWMSGLIAMKERLVNSLGQAMSSEKQVGMIRDAILKGEM